MPVYAETVDIKGAATNTPELIYLGEDEANQTRTIESVLLRSLGVYAYAVQDGQPVYVAIDGEYGYAEGPTYPILNCTVPRTFYQAMDDLGLNYFYNQLKFSVVGTNLYRVVLKVDGEIIVDKTLTQSGTYNLNWISPRKEETIYDVIVYSNNVNVMAWGHITIG